MVVPIMRLNFLRTLVFVPVLTALAQPPGPSTGFEKSVLPVITSTCAPCHNDRMASGGLNLGPFGTKSSVIDQREGWELIIQKVRSGEMPPKGVPRPAEKLDAMMKFLHEEFARADKNVKPDPGRVTAKRLNRNEYTNTIRDLLRSESVV